MENKKHLLLYAEHFPLEIPVPDHKPLKVTDIIGLVIICGGLFLYRFAYDLYKQYKERREGPIETENKYFGIDNKEGIERARQKLLLNEDDDD